MKQPELGQKIADLRKESNLTQEELIEKCNVSVRTLQRIESGDVTPRTSTIRILLETLGSSLEEVSQDSQSSQFSINILSVPDEKNAYEIKFLLQTAWIAGLIYFVLSLIDGGLDIIRFDSYLNINQIWLPVSVKIFVLIGYAFMTKGFVLLGKLFGSYLLKITSYLMLSLMLAYTIMEVWFLLFPFAEEVYTALQIGLSMTVGTIGVVFGVGFFKLRDGMGRLAELVGVIEILVGLCFGVVVLFFLGYLLMIPVTILEIILLFKAYDYIDKEQSKRI